MKFSKHLMVVLVLVVLCSALAGCAGASGGAAPADSKADPLFINMTTDDPHRANMALSFGMKQLDAAVRGYASRDRRFGGVKEQALFTGTEG